MTCYSPATKNYPPFLLDSSEFAAIAAEFSEEDHSAGRFHERSMNLEHYSPPIEEPQHYSLDCETLCFSPLIYCDNPMVVPIFSWSWSTCMGGSESTCKDNYECHLRTCRSEVWDAANLGQLFVGSHDVVCKSRCSDEQIGQINHGRMATFLFPETEKILDMCTNKSCPPTSTERWTCHYCHMPYGNQQHRGFPTPVL